MEHHVGLDVSLKQTAICVVDQTGKVVCEGVVTLIPKRLRHSSSRRHLALFASDWRLDRHYQAMRTDWGQNWATALCKL
jgi:hypothetical protein